MQSLRVRLAASVIALWATCGWAMGQSAGPIYTWNNTGNIQSWVRNFGTNAVTLDNSIPGELTVTETGTPGTTVAITDGANRVRESSTAASGGLDLTGLSSLQFDIGHNGTAPINVQFFVQASTGFSFVALGPDLAVTPGVNTYTVPLAGLTADQQVYIRTVGFNARDHAAQGNVTWTVQEVRSVGPALAQRDLATFNNGTAEGGLQGMIVNFDAAAVQGNDGGQNQTGLSHNAAGSGSLQWTDVGGGPGAALSIGNGTAWAGNTFNNRTTDLSNYTMMVLTMSATDALGGGGTLGVQAFFQKNGFAFEAADGGAGQFLPIDGQFHDLTFSLAGLSNMNVVDQTGINLFAHPQDLVINLDNIRFIAVPEPGSMVLGLAAVGGLYRMRRTLRRRGGE
jgi:hypothetical protein